MKKTAMKKSSLLAVLFVLALPVFIGPYAFAEGDGGDDGDMGGGGCGVYNLTGGSCSVVWFKYTYNDNANSDHPSTWIPEAYNNSTRWGSDGAIGTHSGSNDECRGKSETFYAKGVAMADTNSSDGSSGIFGNSQQFGLAPNTYASKYPGTALKTPVDPRNPKSFAYSDSWRININVSSLYGVNGYTPSDGIVAVASGHVVEKGVALEAFCKAVDYENYSACVTNDGKREDGTAYTIGDYNVTFENGSNAASWFCAYDKEIGKPEELQSTSSASIKKDGDTIVSATANDGEDKRDPETGSKTGLDAGKYHYDRSSIVSFQGDESTTNKIKLTAEQCKNAGLFSWGGVPGIDASLIAGSDATGKNKCSYVDNSDFLLFPGQEKTVSVNVTHQSKIRKDGATNVAKATDSANETSKATVSITANKHKCNNLSDAGDYYIGVKDKSNYRRLGIKKGDFGYQYTGVFPGGGEDQRTLDVFVKPDTSIKFEYQMCSGGLLYDDSVGATEDKNYYAVTSDATNIADKNWIWDGESLEPKNAINWLGITRDRFGSSVEDRLNSGYEATIHSPTKDGFKVTNNELGSTISNTLTADGDETAVSGNVKVPYNYIWEPKTNDITSGVVTVGGTYSFTPSFSKNGRVNHKVGETYSTEEKGDTKKIGAIIKLPSDTTLDGLNSTLSGMLKDNSDVYYYQGGGDEDGSPIKKIGGTEIVSGGSGDKLTHNVETDEIGVKICALSAVWPADSHNLIKIMDGGLDSDIKETDPQNNALTKEVGDNPYWAFKLNCSTIAKAPTMSVEGASAVTAKEANGNSVSYNGRIFGSWTEYDLVANKVNNIGSGASIAYLNAQGSINAAVPASEYGTDSRSKMNPQTLGNLDSSNLGVEPEGQRYFEAASKYARNIVSTFCDMSNFSCSENDYFNFITGPSGNVEITVNIEDDPDGKVNIVYGRNVSIKNDVKIVNAIIYATEKLDTCSEFDKDGKGNQSLYENCSNHLRVNGAVVAKEIVLDRAYGAGSEGSESIEPTKLSLRAEIFNYDPRVLFKIKQYYDSLNVVEETYIKELAPRY